MTEPLPLLIVERNESMTSMLQQFFARREVGAQAVTSIAEAQTVLARRPIQVVLTDLFLPYSNGLSLLHHVRQVAPHTRVVVMGAFPSPDVQQQVVKGGAYALIEKPFRLERLWDVVRQALQEAPCPSAR